jgi:hypothetical protein
MRSPPVNAQRSVLESVGKQRQRAANTASASHSASR